MHSFVDNSQRTWEVADQCRGRQTYPWFVGIDLYSLGRRWV
jgi:hypothetical protein